MGSRSAAGRKHDGSGKSPFRVGEASSGVTQLAPSYLRAASSSLCRSVEDVSIDLLRLIQENGTTVGLTRAVASFLWCESGFEAVGIRLHDGLDYPYLEARGFTSEFITVENSLCSKDAQGEVLSDADGDPLLECMCGNVIKGRFDPALPFFTQRGSFWTNSTTLLLATTTEADRQDHTRNRCNGEGYESVALIPLVVGSDRMGLIQLNDHRPGLLSEEMVALWERLADYLAIALSRVRSEEARRLDQQYYEVLFEGANDMVAVLDPEGRYLQVNQVGCDLLGYTSDELVGTSAARVHASEAVTTFHQTLLGILAKGRSVIEAELRHKDGTLIPVEISSRLIEREGGQLVLSIIRDLRERARAEEALRQKQEEVNRFFRLDAGLLCIADAAGYFRMLSAGWEKVLGYTGDEMMSRPYIDFVHPDDLTRTAEAAHDLADQKELYEFVNRYVAKDGSVHWLSWRVVPAGELMYGTARDITDRKEVEEELRRLNRALLTLRQTNQSLCRLTDEDALLRAMCDIAVNTGGYKLAWVGMVEEGEMISVRPVAWAGVAQGFFDKAVFRWDRDEARLPGPVAVMTAVTQVVQDIEKVEVELPRAAHLRRLGLRSLIALPLVEREQVFGLLVIYSGETNAFGSEEIALIEELAADLSFGIVTLRNERDQRKAETDLHASLQRFERGLEQTVLALVSALESRDAYTAGHQRRVAELAEAVAVRMGLPPDQVRGIFWAATLHDIGKLQVPAEILSKPKKLSDIEMAIIRTHAEAGHQILKGIDFPWPIAQMVLQHHERLDGSGYPSGLQGDEILLDARILAVADAVEARTSHRPYRPARDPDEMWADMTTTSAAQFDQRVVLACREVFQGSDGWNNDRHYPRGDQTA